MFRIYDYFCFAHPRGCGPLSAWHTVRHAKEAAKLYVSDRGAPAIAAIVDDYGILAVIEMVLDAPGFERAEVTMRVGANDSRLARDYRA